MGRKKGRWGNLQQRKRKGKMQNDKTKQGKSKTNLFIIIRMHACLFLYLWWAPGAWIYAEKKKKKRWKDDEIEREKKADTILFEQSSKSQMNNNNNNKFIVQLLCESRGGRPGLSVLTSLLVSVDVKNYWTVLRHWSQLVPNMSTDIWGH